MKLRRIDAARDIADIVSSSGNKVYLNADSLLLNLLGDADEKFEKSVKKSGYWSQRFCICSCCAMMHVLSCNLANKYMSEELGYMAMKVTGMDIDLYWLD